MVLHQVVPPHEQITYLFDPQDSGIYEQTFELGTGSQLRYFVAIIEPETVELQLNIVLNGVQAHAEVAGLYVAHGSQRVTIKTAQIHQHQQTTSSLAINGVLSGTAQACYQGMIFIAENATNSSASQENKNIIADQARAESIPSLEVLTNDVHCTHGSAIGYLDEEQLLYMQSRGIALTQAKKMLLQGFCESVIPHDDWVPALELKKRIEQKL